MNLNRMCQLAGIPLVESTATKVNELNGFKVGDRVSVQDVESKPPVTFEGEIKTLWSDAYAHIQFGATNPKFDQNVQDNGRVPLQKCSKVK